MPFTLSKEIRIKCCVIFALVLAFVLPLGQPVAHAADQGVKARTNSTPIQKRVDLKSPTTAIPANKTAKSARPDLVVSKINYSPGSPKENEEITIWVFVKNIGHGGAARSGLRLQVGGESASIAPVAQVPALNPGREWRYERKVTFGKAGNYRITATADAQNALTETKENNNRRSKKIKVKSGTKPDPSTYLPDLGLMGGTRIGGKTWQKLNTSAVTLTSNDVYVMDYGKVQIQLYYEYREYNGKAVNTPFKNRVYFNNQLVNEEVVSSLGANEIRNKTVVWEIPNPNYNQQAQLKIVIDATDTVTESNTNNNENITTLTFSGL